MAYLGLPFTFKGVDVSLGAFIIMEWDKETHTHICGYNLYMDSEDIYNIYIVSGDIYNIYIYVWVSPNIIYVYTYECLLTFLGM